MGRDDTDEFEVPEMAPTPPVYERVEPRYFGLTPHLLVGALGAAALLAGVALLAGGSVAVGILLLVAGVFLAGLFTEQARRRRSSSLDRERPSFRGRRPVAAPRSFASRR